MIEEIHSAAPLSMKALALDKELQDQVRSHLFGHFALTHFEYVLLVNKEEGNAIFLYSSQPEIMKAAKEPVFAFDQVFQSFMEKHCTDMNPGAMIESVSLSHVIEALKDQPQYTVFYNTNTPEGKVSHKRMLWQEVQELDGYLCAIVEDLSDAFRYADQRSEQLKKALEEAQANLDANNTFLTLISRDIRTPLHSIIGLSRIANMELKDISAVESYLHKISMSGTYMEQTINDIRDFIRISWHPIELRSEVIDLVRFASTLSDHFQAAAAERQLRFSLKTDLAASRIRADAAALRQVLIKLTGNVLNYTLRGGSVELSLTDVVNKDGRVKLSLVVTSRGIDLDQDRVTILRMPYEYVMNEVRSNISSIDMDLVILRAYLHALKGKVSIDTERGIRTSITVVINFAAAADDEEVKHPAPSLSASGVPDFSGKRVLLADDDSINLEVSRKLLENTGLTVFTAKNGQEALSLFTAESGNFDLILMDIRMPVMNGLDAAKAIRNLSLPKAATTPIIAMTVNAFDEDIRQSLDAGMDRHLIKPISPQYLYRVLSDLLG